MPGLEHLHLRHDPVGKVGRGGEIRERIEDDHEVPGPVKLETAGRTRPDVRSEGSDAKPILAVEEEFDLIWS